jgi:hypothetical protein
VYPVSTAFKEAIRQSHRSVVRAEVWRGDTRLLELEPLDGSVEVDARRGVRRTCSLTVAAPDPVLVLDRQAGTYAELNIAYATYTDLAAVGTYGTLAAPLNDGSVLVDSGIVPDTALSVLAPFGNELRLWRGVELSRRVEDDYSDLAAVGTYTDLAAEYDSYAAMGGGFTIEQVEELVPLGVFVITKVDVTVDGAGAKVAVQGSDRSLRFSRARWTEPYTAAAGNAGDAIQDVLEDRWQDVTVDFTATDKTINRAVFGLETDNNPWKDATDLATAAGMELFFDGEGVARLIPVRNYENATPDAVYLENEEAMVLTLSRQLSVDKTYNGVIANGEGSGASATFRGEAWDEDPDSPTYRYGPFGEVPRFYSSPLLTSDDMAQAAAESILAKALGAEEAVDWTQIVDPSLDVGDVVQVVNADTKVDRLMVLDRLTIPLAPTATMSAVARTVRSLGGTGFAEEVA